MDEKQQAAAHYQQTIVRRDRELDVLDQKFGAQSPKSQHLLKSKHNSERQYTTIKSTLGDRSPHIYFETTWMFWVATVFIFSVEIFINKVLFDMALLSSFFVSILASAVLAGILVFMAHLSGVQLRQVRSEYHERTLWGRLVIFCLLVFVMSIVVLGIMYTRAYFESVNQSDSALTTLSDVASLAFSSGFEFFLQKAFASAESAVMGGFNLMALLAAFLVGYLSHDHDIEYDTAHLNLKKATTNYHKSDANFKDKRSKIIDKYDGKLRVYSRQYVQHGGNPHDLQSTSPIGESYSSPETSPQYINFDEAPSVQDTATNRTRKRWSGE